MDAFILYLAKASALTGLFYTAYWLLLKKETFFSPNRWFLLAGLVTSALLPLALFTKVIWVDPAPVVTLTAQDLHLLSQYAAVANATPAPQAPQYTWQDIALGLYIIGALLFLARFLTDVSFIRELLKSHKAEKKGRYRLIDSTQVQSPFSFFNYIVYNSAVLQPHELESILEHEKVHSRQRHSLDMITGQLFCVVLWFNPFVWLYKKAIAQNLEFIADEGASKQVTDTVGYQKTLLKITLQPECIAITNHFYQSLIKKRIVMLNKQKSRRRNTWKYAVVLPALAAFVLAFQVRVVAQERQQPDTAAAVKADVLITHGPTQDKLVIKVDKDTKDSELEARKKTIKDEFNTDMAISNLKRNSKSEITAIKIAFTEDGKNSIYEVSGNQPIKPFTIVMASNGKNDYTVDFSVPENIAAIYPSADNNDTIIFDSGQYASYPVQQPYKYATPAAPAQPALLTASSVSLSFGNEDALIVINGVKYAKGQEIKLPAGHQVTAITTLNDKEGKDKYGKEGKKGAIEITSSPSITITMSPLPAGAAYGYAFPGNMTESHMMDTFPYEVFDHVDFSAGAFNSLSPEKQQEIAEKIELFYKEREQAETAREDYLKHKGYLQYKFEDNRQMLEQKRAEVEQRRQELDKKRVELAAKRAELKRKAEEDRRSKGGKGSKGKH